MDYDVALRIESVESQKYNHCKTSRRYIKILGPRPLYTFLHWIKTSGVKIKPALKKSCLFHELEDMEIWYCENNYSR